LCQPMTGVPVGQAALIAKWGLRFPAPVVVSKVGPGARRTVVANGRAVERYPSSYMPEDSLAGHLRFALRYEPTDLAVLAAAFGADGAARAVEAWVRSEPTGAYARRAWFLYEWLTGEKLEIQNAGAVGYVDALDPALHITAKGIPSRRHTVNDNIAPDAAPSCIPGGGLGGRGPRHRRGVRCGRPGTGGQLPLRQGNKEQLRD
jgi:hypothetical protein